MKPYTIIKEKSLPESELQIEVEISHETLAKRRAEAVKRLSARANIPGFRPGHAPEKVLIEKIGEFAILEEAGYKVVEESLPEILREKNLSFVGDPRVNITKLAAGNPLGFTITVSILPEVKLPDYKKIAAAENGKKPEEVSVSEKELNDFIENIRKEYAQSTNPKSETESQTLPELTDDFVKKLGDFKDVTDFKSKVMENLRLEKERKAREKKRLAIAEAVLKKTDVVVPKVLIESELAKLLARFHDDIAGMGLKIEDYLKHIKKTEEEMRKEWRPDAEKRGKLQLIWNAIAETEKISAPAKTVEEEMKRLLKNYKEADPARTRSYVAMMLMNEKVFNFLETQK